MSTNDQRNRRKYPTYVVDTATAEALSEIGGGIDPLDIPQMRSSRRRLPKDLVDQLYDDAAMMNWEVSGCPFEGDEAINKKTETRFYRGTGLKRERFL